MSRYRDLSRACLLPAVLLAALCLRLFQLGYESIWIDEWSSVTLAQSSVTEIVRDRSQSVNAPLYFVLLHFWSALFGYSEFAVRLPSALCGSLSVLLVYLVGRDLFDRFVGTASAILLSVSVFHVQHSQDARGYTLMAALLLLSLYFYLRLYRAARWSAVGYVLASALLAYTHFYGLLVLLAQNVHALTLLTIGRGAQELTLRRWLCLQLLLAALFAPWSIFLFRQIATIQAGYWIPEPSFASLGDTLFVYSNNRPELVVLFGALACYGTVDGLKTYARSVWLLILLIVAAVLVPYAVSQLSAPVYYTRYTVAASIAFVILVACGVRSLPAGVLRAGALVVLVTMSSAGLRTYYGTPTKAPWREVAAAIDRLATSRDLLLFNDGSYADLVLRYYSRRTDLDGRSFNVGVVLTTERSAEDDIQSVADLDSMARHRARVWLILYKSNDTNGLIRKRLAAERREFSRCHYGDIEVFGFE